MYFKYKGKEATETSKAWKPKEAPSPPLHILFSDLSKGKPDENLYLLRPLHRFLLPQDKGNISHRARLISL